MGSAEPLLWSVEKDPHFTDHWCVSEVGTSWPQIWLLIPALFPLEPPFPHPSGASSSPGTAAMG